MAARSQTTQYYDNITLRNILAKTSTNTFIPPFTVLTSDGVGGTYWSTLSSPTAFVSAFSYISTPTGLYTADASYNQMRFRGTDGVKFSTTLTSNEIVVWGKSFQFINVPLQTAISSSTITLSSFGSHIFSTNSSTQSLYQEIWYPSFRISSPSTNTVLSLNDAVSTITFAGYDAFAISTFQTGLLFQVPSFTSTGFFALQSTYALAESTTFYNLSTYCVSYAEYSTSLQNLSTTLGISTVQYTSDTAQIMSSILDSLNYFSTWNAQTISSFVAVDVSVMKHTDYVPSSISTFSSFLGNLMEDQTIASTQNIFGRPVFQIGPTELYISNPVYLVQEIVSTTSSLTSIYFSSAATVGQLVSSATGLSTVFQLTYESTLSTIGPELSSFSTAMTTFFQASTVSSIHRVIITSTPTYSLFGTSTPPSQLAQVMIFFFPHAR